MLFRVRGEPGPRLLLKRVCQPVVVDVRVGEEHPRDVVRSRTDRPQSPENGSEGRLARRARVDEQQTVRHLEHIDVDAVERAFHRDGNDPRSWGDDLDRQGLAHRTDRSASALTVRQLRVVAVSPNRRSKKALFSFVRPYPFEQET